MARARIVINILPVQNLFCGCQCWDPVSQLSITTRLRVDSILFISITGYITNMSDELSLAVDYIYWFARPWGLCAAVYITANEHLVERSCCADV